jgi:uncharacterized OB-fold protein
MSMTRPRPRLDDLTRPFWTGGAKGLLLIQHCPSCDGWTHPPLPLCRHCGREDHGFAAVPGTGTVDSFTVNHQPWLPGMEVPFIIARVAIDGAPGVYLTTNIVGCEEADLAAGDRVRVTFEEQGDIHFPLFEKAK